MHKKFSTKKLIFFYFAIVSHFKIYEVEVRNITCVWIAKFHFSFSYFLPFQCVYVGRKNWIIGYILCSKIDFLANKNPTFSLKYFERTIKCNIRQLLGMVCNILEAASNEGQYAMIALLFCVSYTWHWHLIYFISKSIFSCPILYKRNAILLLKICSRGNYNPFLTVIRYCKGMLQIGRNLLMNILKKCWWRISKWLKVMIKFLQISFVPVSNLFYV